MSKATEHLRGMLQREDLGAFDKNALCEVLDEHQSYRDDLAAEPLREGKWTELEERVAYAELDVEKANDARDAAQEKAKTAGKMIAELKATTIPRADVEAMLTAMVKWNEILDAHDAPPAPVGAGPFDAPILRLAALTEALKKEADDAA